MVTLIRWRRAGRTWIAEEFAFKLLATWLVTIVLLGLSFVAECTIALDRLSGRNSR